MIIKSIKLVSEGGGYFIGDWGVVETAYDGRKFKYNFEFSNSWVDAKDYLDNVRSDFKNECDDIDFCKDDRGLFTELEKEKATRQSD